MQALTRIAGFTPVLALTLAALLTPFTIRPAHAADYVLGGPAMPIGDSSSSDAAAVATLPGDRMVIVWRDDTITPATCSFRGRIYDDEGLPEAAAFDISSGANCSEFLDTSVGVAADGSFVVAWRNSSNDQGMYAQRFSAVGAPIGGAILLPTAAYVGAQDLTLAVADDGSFWAAWQTVIEKYARKFDALGQPLGPDFIFRTDTFCCVFDKFGIAVDTPGSLLATWSSDANIIVRRFDESGAALGPQIAANETPVDGGLPTILAETDGGFRAFWYQAVAGMWSRSFDATDTATGPSVQVMAPSFSNSPRNHARHVQRTSSGYLFTARRHGLDYLYQFAPTGAAAVPTTPITRSRRGNIELLAVGENDKLFTIEKENRPPYGNHLVRLCDINDASCDRCPGFEDSLDADADGFPDACDDCTNIAGARTIDNPRLFLTKGGQNEGPKVSKLRIRGEVVLPVPFESLDLARDGMQVTLAAATFGYIVNDLIPGVATNTGAWTRSGAKAWRFKGLSSIESTMLTGNVRIMVKNLNHRQPGLIRVIFKHGRGVYFYVEQTADDIPPRIVWRFGDGSQSDICGESTFLVDHCLTRRLPNPSIRCR